MQPRENESQEDEAHRHIECLAFGVLAAVPKACEVKFGMHAATELQETAKREETNVADAQVAHTGKKKCRGGRRQAQKASGW